MFCCSFYRQIESTVQTVRGVCRCRGTGLRVRLHPTPVGRYSELLVTIHTHQKQQRSYDTYRAIYILYDARRPARVRLHHLAVIFCTDGLLYPQYIHKNATQKHRKILRFKPINATPFIGPEVRPHPQQKQIDGSKDPVLSSLRRSSPCCQRCPLFPFSQVSSLNYP